MNSTAGTAAGRKISDRRAALTDMSSNERHKHGMRFKIAVWISVILLQASAGTVYCAQSRAGGASSWRFAVTGDSRGKDEGINREILTDLADRIGREKVKFVLFTGDLVEGAVTGDELLEQLLSWRETFARPLAEKGIRVYPVRGNHDASLEGSEGSIAAWNSCFAGAFALPRNGPKEEKNLTYSFNFGNAFFVGLDMQASGAHRIDQRWLEGQFSADRSRHTFIFVHEPAYALKGKHAHGDGISRFPAARDAFVKSFLKTGGSMYFCGHDHWYDHARIRIGDRTLEQFIVGIAGAPLRSWEGKYSEKAVIGVSHAEKYGYLIVEVAEDEVRTVLKERVRPGIYAETDHFVCRVSSAMTAFAGNGRKAVRRVR